MKTPILEGTRPMRHVVRGGVGLACLGICLWGIQDRLGTLSAPQIAALLAQTPVAAWLAALALTLLSFWAVGRYDGLAHRHLGTGIAPPRAVRAGTVAIALSQTLGFGLITGALARWRLLPELGLARSLKLSAFVAASFVAAGSVLAALACLVLPAPGWTRLPALGITALLPVIAALLFCCPQWRLRGRVWHLPTLPACVALLGWTLLDTAAAAAALYLLIPDTGALSLLAFYPVFLLALGAALLSGSPGGVGPFELVLLALLPQIDPASLVAGIVGFRLIYYALPAIAAVLLLLPTRPHRALRPVALRLVPDLFRAPRAEVGIIRQNGGWLLQTSGGACAVWRTGQTVTALFDPVSGPALPALRGLQAEARAHNRIACLYKSGSRTACAARRLGWTTLHIADEGILDPQRFDPDTPSRRALRRKLRLAHRAGLRLELAEALPLSAMRAVDADWQARNGTARGGTMGRMSPDYLADQQVVLAWQGERLAGFASFHASCHEWCLDVMRLRGDAPDGTMQAVVHHALLSARARGIARFSLAAVPACPDPGHALYRALARRVVARAGGPGLRQFKSAFGPRWQPLYAAAPTPAALALALADIAWAVTHPARAEKRHPHDGDEQNEIASRHAS